MASDDRFYLMEMRNRPVKYGDIGSTLRIEGVVYGGGGAHAILLLPGLSASDLLYPDLMSSIHTLDTDEWSDFIRRTDDPEILVGPAKVFQRKLRWEISGAVQQKVWAADGFRCQYCGAYMGNALLTIDHFRPLELNGKNDVTNYLTSCKACNKDKGSEDPEAWCARRGYRYQHFVDYLDARVVK